jgi:NAD(P)-dependent dehydrogenase (short-subunit alcohol dehydrogenase family)
MDLNQKRTFLVTGSTSGIGLAITENLVEKGHKVIGVGRSHQRCSEQDKRLKEIYPQISLVYFVADLSRQDEIRSLAGEVRKQLTKWDEIGLDGLVNNAGTFTFWQSLTAEGFETQWAVNHLAPFLLTNLLLPELETKSHSRVITISSGSHYGARLKWTDIQGLRRYNPLRAYKHTKLANVLFTAELNRRLEPDSPLRALAADPGLVNTSIGEKSPSRIAQKLWKRRRKKGIDPVQSAAQMTGIT